jgi:hypothetical protein
LPFLLFCLRSYQSFRPIELMTPVFFALGLGAFVIWERRVRSGLFAPRGQRQRLLCCCLGIFYGVALLICLQCWERIQSAPWDAIKIGLSFCAAWLAPFALLALLLVFGIQRHRERNGKSMFSYSIIDLWAAIIGLTPGMLLARANFDLNVVLLMFIAQAMGIAALKSLYDAYRSPARWHESAFAVIAGAQVGLLGGFGAVHYLITGRF